MIKSFALACLLIVSAHLAQAGVLYSTDGTATPGFFPSNGSTSTSVVYHAFQFTATTGGVFDELVTAAGADTAFTATFYLRADSSGSLGSILDTVSIPLLGDGTGHMYTASSTNHVTLTAGTKYWIEAVSGAGSYNWLQADPVTASREYSSVSGYFNDQGMSAFALLETPATSGVPEPGTWTLVGVGLLPLLRLKRSRR